ncbi:transcriptional regulator GcvA [Hwanghaeella sp. LZ110]|jgi:LysR family glycine cleavage system transcriptional activator|uniref:transcriptional regulator GcvA n=1 Tax=Hwanghaeella sp. LZ110 TaxID=3402810 RepID=UPI003B682960
MRRLPPLKAVRAFEASARHDSFVAAADELAVTPSAISQQVKQLEAWLGQPLFRRLPQGLMQTDIARGYLPHITQALDIIDQASRAITSGQTNRTLTVTCLSSFGAQWLGPRLHRFYAANPGIDVLLATFDRTVDLETEDVDIAIRYGKGDYPNLHVEELGEDNLGVVCSPEVLNHPKYPLKSYADLAHHVLLHDAHALPGHSVEWTGFLDKQKVTGIDATRGPRFSDSHMIVQSCIAGRGIMIGRSVLIEDELNAGILVAPFGMPQQSLMRYRLLMRKGAIADPKIATFRNWLYEELGKTPPDF